MTIPKSNLISCGLDNSSSIFTLEIFNYKTLEVKNVINAHLGEIKA